MSWVAYEKRVYFVPCIGNLQRNRVQQAYTNNIVQQAYTNNIVQQAYTNNIVQQADAHHYIIIVHFRPDNQSPNTLSDVHFSITIKLTEVYDQICNIFRLLKT